MTELLCKTKKRHPGEFVARAAAAIHLNRHPEQSPLFVYPCPHCAGWHLTKKQQGAAVTASNPYEEHHA